MTEHQLADIWMLFKEHIDKKLQEVVAERYVDLLADYGISDKIFEGATGVDDVLDTAIEYYLDQEDDDIEEDEEDDY
jgi:hypothetical protein